MIMEERIEPPPLESNLETTERETSNDVQMIAQEDPIQEGHAEKESLRKILVGNIPEEATVEDFQYYFEKFGIIEAIDLKEGLEVCIEFATHASAIEAIKEMHSQIFMGKEISVSLYPLTTTISSTIKHEMNNASLKKGSVQQNRRTEHRLIAYDLDYHVSWQDLKDFGRSAGDVNYTNVYTHHGTKIGIIEYFDNASVKKALNELNDKRLYAKNVVLEKDRGQMDFIFNQPRKRSTHTIKNEMGGTSTYSSERLQGGASTRRKLSSPPYASYNNPTSHPFSSQYRLRSRSFSPPPSRAERYSSTHVPPSAHSIPYRTSPSPHTSSRRRAASVISSSSYRKPTSHKTGWSAGARQVGYSYLEPPAASGYRRRSNEAFASSHYPPTREEEGFPTRHDGSEFRLFKQRPLRSPGKEMRVGRRTREEEPRYDRPYVSTHTYEEKERFKRRSAVWKAERNGLSPPPRYSRTKVSQWKMRPHSGERGSHLSSLDSVSFSRISREGYHSVIPTPSHAQTGRSYRKSYTTGHKQWPHFTEYSFSRGEKRRHPLPRRPLERRGTASPPPALATPSNYSNPPPSPPHSYVVETPFTSHTVEEKSPVSSHVSVTIHPREEKDGKEHVSPSSSSVSEKFPSDETLQRSHETASKILAEQSSVATVPPVESQQFPERPESVAYSTPRDDVFSPECTFQETSTLPPEIHVEAPNEHAAAGVGDEGEVDDTQAFHRTSSVPHPGVSSPSLSAERPLTSSPPTVSQRTSSLGSIPQLVEKKLVLPSTQAQQFTEGREGDRRVYKQVNRKIFNRPEWRGDRRIQRRIHRRPERISSHPLSRSETGTGGFVRTRPFYGDRARPMISAYRKRSASFSPPQGRPRRMSMTSRDDRIEATNEKKKNYLPSSEGHPPPPLPRTARRSRMYAGEKAHFARFANESAPQHASTSSQPPFHSSGRFEEQTLSSTHRRSAPYAVSQKRDLHLRGPPPASLSERRAPPSFPPGRERDEGFSHHSYGASFHRQYPSTYETTNASVYRNTPMKSSVGHASMRSKRSLLPPVNSKRQRISGRKEDYRSAFV